MYMLRVVAANTQSFFPQNIIVYMSKTISHQPVLNKKRKIKHTKVRNTSAFLEGKKQHLHPHL